MLLVVAATEPELRATAGLTGVEALVCGVGPVDAGIAVATRLADPDCPVRAVLHIGIAGMRAGADIAIGDLVVGDAAAYCDTESRFVIAHADPDAELVTSAHRALPAAHLRTIGTSADVGGTDAARYDIEAMEGFAVLRAAALAGIPAVEVRAVSNEIDEPDRALWQFDTALDALAAALPALVRELASQHDD